MGGVQPKIKSKVRCVDREVGEIVHVIADPLSLDVSHIVVRANGTERQVPVSAIGAVRGESVELTCNAAQFAGGRPPQAARPSSPSPAQCLDGSGSAV